MWRHLWIVPCRTPSPPCSRSSQPHGRSSTPPRCAPAENRIWWMVTNQMWQDRIIHISTGWPFSSVKPPIVCTVPAACGPCCISYLLPRQDGGTAQIKVNRRFSSRRMVTLYIKSKIYSRFWNPSPLLFLFGQPPPPLVFFWISLFIH